MCERWCCFIALCVYSLFAFFVKFVVLAHMNSWMCYWCDISLIRTVIIFYLTQYQFIEQNALLWKFYSFTSKLHLLFSRLECVPFPFHFPTCKWLLLLSLTYAVQNHNEAFHRFQEFYFASDAVLKAMHLKHQKLNWIAAHYGHQNGIECHESKAFNEGIDATRR